MDVNCCKNTRINNVYQFKFKFCDYNCCYDCLHKKLEITSKDRDVVFKNAVETASFLRKYEAKQFANTNSMFEEYREEQAQIEKNFLEYKTKTMEVKYGANSYPGTNMNFVNNEVPIVYLNKQFHELNYKYKEIKGTPNNNPRIKASLEQIEYLSRVFDIKQKLSLSERASLAETVGLSERFIQLWFQKRRLKNRKDSMEKHTTPQMYPYPTESDALLMPNMVSMPKMMPF